MMSYTMAQRTQEVGIRMALGAAAGQVTGMVVRDGMRLVAIALVIGLAGAAGAVQLLEAQLFAVQPLDPITFGAVSALLATVALVACWLPARRASRVSPTEALRAE
jgi:ABC-type antimicrobial peptide transport system permease subunit